MKQTQNPDAVKAFVRNRSYLGRSSALLLSSQLPRGCIPKPEIGFCSGLSWADEGHNRLRIVRRAAWLKRLTSAVAMSATFVWALGVQGQNWELPENAPLLTRWSKTVGPTNVLPDYPRPQMARETWQNLNGLWDYAISSKSDEKLPASYDGKILVPYPIESALSGVMRAFLPTNRLWYHRTITIPASWRGQRILVHFGAVDWEAELYVNGRELGGHRGGYDAFTFDITKALSAGETQDLVLSVLDPTETSWHLHGKQSLHPAGCNYTACSGIWQTVWSSPAGSPDDQHRDFVRGSGSRKRRAASDGHRAGGQ